MRIYVPLFRVVQRIPVAGFIFVVLFAVLLLPASSAKAFTTNDVNTALDAYLKNFCKQRGANAIFKASQKGGIADFWKHAEEIECIIDGYDYSSNATCKAMIAPLLNGFVKIHGTNWAYNGYNDDCLWASIAFARGSRVIGDPKFSDIARRNFDMIYNRAWNQALGGGLYWFTNNASKNACVNGPGGIAAFLLYQVEGDQGYLDKARAIYAWERSTLFDPAGGGVSDSIGTNGTIHHWRSTYNQGTFIGLANYLGQTNDAALAADFTRDHLAQSGILEQYEIAGNNSGFNSIFLRWMTRFMKDRGLEAQYLQWLQLNADTAWNIRRQSDNLAWCQWRRQTPENKKLYSWDCTSTLEALLVTPPE